MKKTYVTRQKHVNARQITEQSEMVDTYNGMRVAKQGDFVVNENGRIMVMRKDKFLLKYEEKRDEIHSDRKKWLQGNFDGRVFDQ